jgi:drug/metabolite transporter, DME family
MAQNQVRSRAQLTRGVEGSRLWGATGQVLAAAALCGSTGTAQSLGGAPDPVAVGAARLAVGGTVLVLLALGSPRRSLLLACLTRPLVGWTVAAGITTALYQTAFFSAVQSTGVATGTVVALGTAPIATGLCGMAVFGERLSRWWATATVLAVTGCALLVITGGSAGAVRPVGVALAVVAGTCYGVYTTAAKVLLSRGLQAVPAMAACLGVGALLLGPVLVNRATTLASPSTMVMVVWLGVVTTALSYALFASGLQRLPASTVGTLSLAEPLTATVLALLVVGERPGLGATLGGICVLAGLAVAVLRPTTLSLQLDQHIRRPLKRSGERHTLIRRGSGRGRSRRQGSPSRWAPPRRPGGRHRGRRPRRERRPGSG